jgi:hypothetical protein
MVHVFGNIYLGSCQTSENLAQLNEWHIGCIFNVAKKCKNMFIDKFDYVSVPFDDDSFLPKDIMDTLVDIMHTYILQNINIFVHCRMGKSRSVFTIAYYLVKYQKFTSKKALDLIKGKKKDVAMSVIFVDQLKEYELINKSKSTNLLPENLIKRIKLAIKLYNDAVVTPTEKEKDKDKKKIDTSTPEKEKVPKKRVKKISSEESIDSGGSDDESKKDTLKNKKLNLDVTDEEIHDTIWRHKRVKALIAIIKEGKKIPKGRQINYNITISKKSNFLKQVKKDPEVLCTDDKLIIKTVQVKNSVNANGYIGDNTTIIQTNNSTTPYNKMDAVTKLN